MITKVIASHPLEQSRTILNRNLTTSRRRTALNRSTFKQTVLELFGTGRIANRIKSSFVERCTTLGVSVEAL